MVSSDAAEHQRRINYELNQSRSVPGSVAAYLQLQHTNHEELLEGDMAQHNTEALHYIRDTAWFPMRGF